MQQKPVLSVSEFNQTMNHMLGRIGQVSVQGEISQLQIRNNNLIFMTIKDQKSAVSVFGLANELRNIHSLDEGMLVTVSGIPGVYQRNTGFRIRAYEINPVGEGALKQAYDKLKAQLESEGLFDPSHKRTLPKFPEKIGLLTAKDSQAYLDFTKIVRERSGGMQINFLPITVQGQQAVPSILKALAYFNAMKDQDILVLTRGGGSLEDLIAFNDERVVRAVAASKIPIVCAIGHEGDVSLAELAADTRASTPSNAAELSILDQVAITNQVNFQIGKIESTIQSQLSHYQHKTNQALSRIQIRVQLQTQIIEDLIQKFHQQFKLTTHRIGLLHQKLDSQTNLLTIRADSWLQMYQANLENIEKLLHSYDYRQVLRRGYSVIRNSQGKILTKLDQVKLADSITSEMHDGTMTATITKLQKKHE